MNQTQVSLTNKHFIDWEASVFGFGYGTGEEHTIKALKEFLASCNPVDGPVFYDHQELEAKLGPTAAWLLINILCHAGLVDYGTSPRHGWLTGRGSLLKKFTDRHTTEQLCEMVDVCGGDYVHCLPGQCNCQGEPCNNPMFVEE